jgi:hypothetical protein
VFSTCRLAGWAAVQGNCTPSRAEPCQPPRFACCACRRAPVLFVPQEPREDAQRCAGSRLHRPGLDYWRVGGRARATGWAETRFLSNGAEGGMGPGDACMQRCRRCSPALRACSGLLGGFEVCGSPPCRRREADGRCSSGCASVTLLVWLVCLHVGMRARGRAPSLPARPPARPLLARLRSRTVSNTRI